MNVSFTRTAPQGCTTVVRRDDGREFDVAVYGVPRRLPHDLVHFSVERALGWQTGFWGYVARGAEFPSMHQRGGRRPFHAAERARALLSGAKDLLGEAENLAAVIDRIVETGREGDRQAVARSFAMPWWPPGSHAQRLPYAEVLRACAALREAEAAWQALPVGQSLTLPWSLRRGPATPEFPGRPLIRLRAA